MKLYYHLMYLTLQDSNTVLMLAAGGGHLEVVRILTEWGVAIDTQNEVGCPTVLKVQTLLS